MMIFKEEMMILKEHNHKPIENVFAVLQTMG